MQTRNPECAPHIRPSSPLEIRIGDCIHWWRHRNPCSQRLLPRGPIRVLPVCHSFCPVNGHDIMFLGPCRGPRVPPAPSFLMQGSSPPRGEGADEASRGDIRQESAGLPAYPQQRENTGTEFNRLWIEMHLLQTWKNRYSRALVVPLGADLRTHRHPDTQARRHPDAPKHRHIDTHRHTDTETHTDAQTPRHSGSQKTGRPRTQKKTRQKVVVKNDYNFLVWFLVSCCLSLLCSLCFVPLILLLFLLFLLYLLLFCSLFVSWMTVPLSQFKSSHYTLCLPAQALVSLSDIEKTDRTTAVINFKLLLSRKFGRTENPDLSPQIRNPSSRRRIKSPTTDF